MINEVKEEEQISWRGLIPKSSSSFPQPAPSHLTPKKKKMVVGGMMVVVEMIVE